MIIQDFKPFEGVHCETTATGSLLNQLGIELSEPMLFGLGEGLGYGYFFFKMMPHPFIGGRLRQGEITENLCRNLNLKLNVKETTSLKKAWKNVSEEIVSGRAVGLQLDCYHLEYFTKKIHFAGHFVSMYGFDNRQAYLVDTSPQGTTMQTSLESLALARSEKGPMSAKNKSYTIEKTTETVSPNNVIKQAILNNTTAFLNPPIKNLGYKGILKTSIEIKKWFKKTDNINRDFQSLAMLMERAGTGGSLFRNLYRDFLKESATCLNSEGLYEAYNQYIEIAQLWKEVSDLFHQAGESETYSFVEKASDILVDLFEMERKAMETAQDACSK